MISTKWRKMQNIYLYFKQESDIYDYSENAAEKMYQYESTGVKFGDGKFMFENGKYNGYAVSKHVMDLTVKMWNISIDEDYPRSLNPYELYNSIPDDIHWWLDKVLKWKGLLIPNDAKHLTG